MADTVVKKLNEIADQIAGEDVEDATNVTDALIGIGNAFGGEGDTADNVADALEYVKQNVSGGGDPSSLFKDKLTVTCASGSSVKLIITYLSYDAEYGFSMNNDELAVGASKAYDVIQGVICIKAMPQTPNGLKLTASSKSNVNLTVIKNDNSYTSTGYAVFTYGENATVTFTASAL